MTIAVYPGTFDPITNGHLDIINRASAVFDKLTIGVYDQPEKQLLFSLEERMDMVEKAVADLSNVCVKSFSGLTVDFIREVGGTVMIRGLRVSSDFEREFEMALMNKKLAPDIELICLMTSSEYQFLSSSLIKEVAKLGGCLRGMVPDHVATALREKFSVRIPGGLKREG
ncbi:MAG: pantetheine-phosphate adenylyltransferase [Chloroflexi bacterium CG23_combo_of_CG06-09_8_20_14_all_45_10]|nr:MAG: pantetheine-phosphate adenylyltransferase [Chloroflexi bacterium CG23_combo_of_CG06-09_8_20_14_all_45_10]